MERIEKLFLLCNELNLSYEYINLKIIQQQFTLHHGEEIWNAYILVWILLLYHL